MAERHLAKELKRRMAALSLSQKGLAQLAGLNDTAVRDIVSGRSRHPRHDTIEKLAEALGCSAAELLDDKAGPVVRAHTDGEGYVLIARYDPRKDAGREMLTGHDRSFADVAFRAEWLAELTRTPANQLAMVTMSGDSMTPTVGDGDQLLVDLTQWSPGTDGIYVVRQGDSLLVKRLTADPMRQQVVMSSDNPTYASLAPLAPAEIDLLGRVIWIGRKA
ncbi:MAG: LexA family transcriptional regulator [Pseudomonadota bacterium]